MNVPKPLRFEVEPNTVLKILNILYTCTVRTIYTDCSRAHRILRHVIYHSVAKSEKETSQLAAGYGSRVVRLTSCPTSSGSFIHFVKKRLGFLSLAAISIDTVLNNNDEDDEGNEQKANQRK